MNNASNTAPRRWALLIGIDYYTNDIAVAGGANPKARCLEGCVKDVQAAKDYLNKALVPADTVTILTATTPADRSSSRPQEEDIELWPTHDNVTKALENIRDSAQPGDFALIHFSGHGARTPPVPNAGHHSTGQLALALFDQNGFRLMRGYTLGKYLEDIAGRGVFVTLVLDCCFAGDIFRGGRQNSATVRSINYSPTLTEEAAEGGSTMPSTFRGANSVLRDSSLHVDYWLVHPTNYTVLSAAGPYERAEEFEVAGQGKRGVLSYFLYEALNVSRQRGLKPTHGSVYHHVRTTFRARRPRQNPMCYGNKELAFLSGPTASHHPGFVAVFRPEQGGFLLDAGEAHGVCTGDEYDAYPSELRNTTWTAKVPVRLRVHAVHFLTSDLELVEDDSAYAIQDVETGWTAKLVTSLCPTKTPVRLTPAVDAGPLLTSDALPKCCFLHLYRADENHGPSCTFMLTVNDRNEYQVLDELGKQIPSIPPISLQLPEALSRFLSVVHHVTKYKYLESIDNRTPNASLENSFSLNPTHKATSAGTFDVQHRSAWGFDVENLGGEALYVFVFDFGPSWNITNIYEAAKKGECLVVAPKTGWDTGKKVVRMRMEIPDHLLIKGNRRCEDVIKVFVTTIQTSFSSFVLPKLLHGTDELDQEPGPEGTETNVRGHLPNGLLGLGSGSHTSSRGSGSWAVRSFIVRTSA